MINFFGPVNTLGTGVHCYNLALAYERLTKESVCLIPPFGNANLRDEHVDRWLQNRNDFDVHNPSIMIFDTAFLTQFSGTPRIGYAVFETDELTLVQLKAVRSCDHVLVPSTWGQMVLTHHGVKSHVIPEGYDPIKFPVGMEIQTETSVPRFLHVGKSESRKGTMQVLKCFAEALEENSANLTMHCENPFMNGGGWDQLQEALYDIGFRPVVTPRSGNPLNERWKRGGLLVRLSFHQDSLSELYRTHDCGVFPSKGEGWGLPILECIASGTPAIVGNWSGQSEFLGTDYPKELTLAKPNPVKANDGVWFHGDRGYWYEPTDTDLIARFRWAYANVRDFKSTPEWKTAVDQCRSFTWQNAAEMLQLFLETMCGRKKSV